MCWTPGSPGRGCFGSRDTTVTTGMHKCQVQMYRCRAHVQNGSYASGGRAFFFLYARTQIILTTALNTRHTHWLGRMQTHEMRYEADSSGRLIVTYGAVKYGRRSCKSPGRWPAFQLFFTVINNTVNRPRKSSRLSPRTYVLYCKRTPGVNVAWKKKNNNNNNTETAVSRSGIREARNGVEFKARKQFVCYSAFSRGFRVGFRRPHDNGYNHVYMHIYACAYVQRTQSRFVYTSVPETHARASTLLIVISLLSVRL